jgi:amino acid permease
MSSTDAIGTVPVEEKNIPEKTHSQSGSEDVGKEEAQVSPGLHRKLKARHLQMIAIGMAIVHCFQF